MLSDSEDGKKDKMKKDKKASKGVIQKMTKEEEGKRAREIHHKKFMNFPTNSGVSGHVFKTHELFYSNNASKETKFQEELDNQSDATDIRNFMIGPVFGQDKSK